ncbi:MAG: hypothetical protein NVSMB21_05820 [Vulcanimicrobiaceae bacterium]
MKLFRTFSAARHELPRVLPLLRDTRVPTWAKLAAVGAAAFVISPLNILGDIPLLGFFDDAALLAFVIHYFVRFAEGRIANEIVPARKTVTSAVALH